MWTLAVLQSLSRRALILHTHSLAISQGKISSGLLHALEDAFSKHLALIHK